VRSLAGIKLSFKKGLGEKRELRHSGAPLMNVIAAKKLLKFPGEKLTGCGSYYEKLLKGAPWCQAQGSRGGYVTASKGRHRKWREIRRKGLSRIACVAHAELQKDGGKKFSSGGQRDGWQVDI